MPYKDLVKRKEYDKIWQAERHKSNKAKAFEILSDKCIRCGNDDKRILEFDHIIEIRRKTSGTDQGRSLARQIANGTLGKDKIQVLCPNCHALKTFYPKDFWSSQPCYNKYMTKLNFNKTALGMILDIHDGDTLTLAIKMKKTRMKDQDLGYHVHVEDGWITLHTPIRFYGINAPELSTPEGIVARDFLETQVAIGDTLKVETALNPEDKYGRWLGILYKDKLNINDLMVSTGHAIPYFPT